MQSLDRLVGEIVFLPRRNRFQSVNGIIIEASDSIVLSEPMNNVLLSAHSFLIRSKDEER